MANPTHTQVQEWYNAIYAKHGIHTMRPEHAYGVFLDYLHLSSNEKLLDIACGTGFLLKKAVDKGCFVSGVDISATAIEIAKSVVPSAQLHVSTAESLPFENNYFDAVTCLGSIEHFLDVEAALAEMQRVSKPQAQFCFVVPNKWYLFDVLSGKHGTQQQEIKETLRSLRDWKDLFVKNGFKIQGIYQDQWIKDSLNKPNTGEQITSPTHKIQQLKLFLKRILWQFMPISLTYQFVFVLRK